MRRIVAALAVLAFAACASSARETHPSDLFTADYTHLHPAVVFFKMKIPADDAKRKKAGLRDDAYGSGFVVESGAWGSRILTDAHVVADSTNLLATIGDGRSAPAHFLATSSDEDDLALVFVPLPNEAVAPLGHAAGLIPGTQVGVLGYPIPDAFLDEGLGTAVSLYTGRLSSVRKNALELDLPIIPGESGGPVFEASSGQVIGIAESRFDEERAIGFATPVETIRAFLAAHPRL